MGSQGGTGGIGVLEARSDVVWFPPLYLLTTYYTYYKVVKPLLRQGFSCSNFV